MIVRVLTTCHTQHTANSSMDQEILFYVSMCSSYALLIMFMSLCADSYRQFGTDWIVVLLSVETQTVHI
jgi:hypothetical protein